ncbi:hypothetical protein FQN54_004063 [Arachnomyces sp. PD_36]|nr:hypothetical protein FQN54_004063 [Arachnomyces sp. PD_36]
MPRFNSPFDGAQLFYRDYVPASSPTPWQANEKYVNKKLPTLVFIHGWPLSSLMWEQLMVPLCETYRMRCIAPDRRGFGASDWNGPEMKSSPIDYDVFADDTAHLLEKLDVGPLVFIASSMGPGETVLAHSRSSYVQKNCKGFIWIGAALPYNFATPENPTAPPRELWDSLVKGFRDARADFSHDSLPSFLSPEGQQGVSNATVERYVRIVGDADAIAIERCIQLLTETNFTENLHSLAKIDIPVLCLHGDKDTGAPAEATIEKLRVILPRAMVKMYINAGHGTYVTHKDQTIEDILGFVDVLDL